MPALALLLRLEFRSDPELGLQKWLIHLHRLSQNRRTCLI